MYETLALRVKYILELRKWSGRELARRCHMRSQSHVNLILKGGVPAYNTVARIAAAAQVSVSWLVTGQGLPLAFGGDLIPAPLPPPPAKSPPPRPLPEALKSALREREDIYDLIKVGIPTWHERERSEEDWRDFIDALQSTCRLFDHKFVGRKDSAHDKVVAKSVVDVARSQTSRGDGGTSAKTRRR